jgi:hypothetical protein
MVDIGIVTTIATGTSIFIVTGIVDKANAPTGTSGPCDDYDTCCQSASATIIP